MVTGYGSRLRLTSTEPPMSTGFSSSYDKLLIYTVDAEHLQPPMSRGFGL